MDKDRSASDIADIDRASSAGEKDGAEGSYEPKSEDTPDQKEAYDRSNEKAQEKDG